MPSPIAHAAAGYAIYRLYVAGKRSKHFVQIGSLAGLITLTLLLSWLPDFDIIPGILLGDFDLYHNSITNSLVLGLVIASVVALLVRVWVPSQSVFWLVLVLMSYEIHVIMDYLGAESGVLLFWPLTSERFAPPIKLFYGFHHSDGWISIRHLWTFATEIVFASVVYIAVQLVSRNRRSLKAKNPYHNE